MNSFDFAVKAYNEGAVFAAFDIETTGLDPRQNKIVELGAVKFDNRGLIARFSTLINPGIPMPEEAARVNNISDEMLKDKPPLDEVMPDFLSFTKGAVLAAHNAPFDCGFINENLGKALPNPIVDTLAVSKELFPGLRSYSLQNLAAALGINALDAHRAEDDSRLCMEIFLHCVESAKKPGF